jgi:hypothetical protein
MKSQAESEDMVKIADNRAVSLSPSLPAYTGREVAAGYGSPPIKEIAAAALTRLRRDLETFHPNRPALSYALAGETHQVTLVDWRQYPTETQLALLEAFLDGASELLRQLQARLARMVPTNGYMFGLQDEAIKLETQADITLEEIRRIETALRALGTGAAVQ